VLVGGAAGGIGYVSSLRVTQSAMAVAFGVPVAVLMRVLVEGIDEPTSHNLWPLELALSLGIALPPAFAGVFIGHRLQPTESATRGKLS